MCEKPDIEPEENGEEKTNEDIESFVTYGAQSNHVDEVSPEEGDAAADEHAALKDKFLRARAELENYRKRMQRDVTNAGNASVMNLARMLLPALDNFDRALESAADDHKKFKSFYKGIAMIEQQLYKALEDGGIKRIEVEGKPFDPNFHEAVSVMNDPDKPEDSVVAVVEKGYVYKGLVVRPAKVVISKKP